MRFLYGFLCLLILLLPNLVSADFVVSAPSGDPFDNPQNLIVTITASSKTPLLDHGTIPLPINQPVSLSYSLDHKPTWPNYRDPAGNDSLFADYIKSNKLYMDLWEGVPFTSSAHMIQTWDISGTSTGQVTATFPKQDSYFIVAYFPDGFYQDPESACPNDPDWQTDCAPNYTLDQMRGYFSYPSDSPDAFSYLPDAFGGTEFTSAPLATTQVSNVLFLPGIEGSRLYMRNELGSEVSLWEPPVLSGLSNLALNSDGSSKYEIYTRDLVDYKYGIKALGDVYGPFEDFMNGLVSSGTISNWVAYPYDWRFDVRDIVSNGTLVGDSTGPVKRIFLTDVVQQLASTSPTGKVTIVAHSNGGLLAKALAIELQKENKINLLDQIIFIGSPQLGTPLTIGSLLNGDGQTDPTGGLIMYGGDVRAVAATMPGMYGLLPTSEYFMHQVDAPILFVTNTIENLYEKYFGSEINSESSLTAFLTDVPNLHSNFPANDLRTPLVLSDEILRKEIQTHDILDAWTPPDGLAVTSISGWGNPTPYQYTYSTSNKKVLSCFRTTIFLNTCAYAYQVRHALKNSIAGDDTVVSVSALDEATSSFYFNAKTFSGDKFGSIGHGNLTSATPIQLLIKNLLEVKSETIPYISTSSPTDKVSPSIVVSVHSPMNIIATDSDGNQTGIFPVPGKAGIYYEKENIPGSSLQLLDDEKYLYLPEDAPYTISLTGYDDGLTTLDFGTTDENGDATTTEEFSDIPTTTSTSAQFSIQSDASSMFPTTIDVDVLGDGSTTEFGATQDGLQSVSATEIYSLLKKEFYALIVRRGIKNRFLSELSKGDIPLLEKLIAAQINLKLTESQGTFFLQLLDQLKSRS